MTGLRCTTVATTACLLCALAAPASAAPQAAGRFSVYGLAPAAAGQDRARAEAALGQALTPEAVPAARAATRAAALAASAAGVASVATQRCHHRQTTAQPGVRYALAGEVITRIETRDMRYSTLSGLHVGDTVARAQQVYGKRLHSTPHPYFDRGRVLTVYAPDRKFALVMESNDQGRIVTLRGGRLPEVTWLEGCS